MIREYVLENMKKWNDFELKEVIRECRVSEEVLLLQLEINKENKSVRK